MDFPPNQKGFAPIVLFFVVAILAILSFALIYFFKSHTSPSSTDSLESNSPPPSVEVFTPTSSASPIASSSSNCSKDCQAMIDQKIAALKQDLLKSLQSQNSQTSQTLTQVLTPTTPPAQATSNQTSNQPKVIYINFGVSGSTNVFDGWADVSGSQITFNTANYPGAKGFYFQANLVSDAPDRAVYARIYDITHKVGVINSDINYTGNTSTLKLSPAMNIFSGDLTLDVQVHGLNGNLATVQNPTIKIIY